MNFTKKEVEKLLEPIKIAKVLEIREHPNADRLVLVDVVLSFDSLPTGKAGAQDDKQEVKQVVTGADNMKPGDLVPYLGEGNVIPGYLLTKGEEIILKKKDLRGVVSDSMILAEDEIGLSDDHEGILVIEGDDQVVGKSIVEVLGDGLVEGVMENVRSREELLKGLKSVTEEIIGEKDLISLLQSGQKINHYIGFEISGLVHLGTGLMAGLVIRELQKLGVHTRVFLADWHTWINDKLEGDRDLIREVAKEYFGPALKVSAEIAGADPDKIEIINGSELYHNNDKYWQTVVDVSKNLTLSRVLKSTSIMGREERNSQPFAYLIYPPMQAADIFEMQNHIAHAGTDQRKIHVITREVAEKISSNQIKLENGRILKPIAIHHTLVAGLQKPAVWPIPEDADKEEMMTKFKMSKSVKGSAIFIHDSEDEIRESIRNAFCPPKEIGYNPVLNWVKNMIFPITDEITIKRDPKFGDTFTVKTYEELEERFASGDLFPLDLKNNVADILVEILKPARDRFADKKSQSLIQKIREIKKKR